MGELGENLMFYSEKLIFDFALCKWAIMPLSEVLILFWLKDLKSENHHQHMLGKLTHKKWNQYTDSFETMAF